MLGVLLLIGGPVVLSGASLPLLFDHLRHVYRIAAAALIVAASLLTARLVSRVTAAVALGRTREPGHHHQRQARQLDERRVSSPRWNRRARWSWPRSPRASSGRLAGLPQPLLVGEAARVGAENSLVRRRAARYGGVLPETEHRQLVSQACLYRIDQRASLLVQWQRQAPGSAALRDLLGWAPGGGPTSSLRYGAPFSRELVSGIAP